MARLLQVGGSHYLVSGAGYYASAPPSLALSVVSTDFSEGATVTFRVTASAAWDEAITVAYATSNGTATAGVDYTAASGTAILPAGTTTVDIDVVTINRSGVQADRTFTLTLSSPVAESGDIPALTTASQQVTIDDTSVEVPTPHIIASVVGSPPEEGQAFTFRVSTVGLVPAPNAISFQYETADGTAVSGVDYTPTSGNGTIPINGTSFDVTVQTTARTGYQGARTVQFTIVSASATIDTATATGTILDTERPAGDHGYYESLIALPQMHFHRTMRSVAELTEHMSGYPPMDYWSYDPSSDTHPDAEDAAKLVLPFPNPNVNEQILIPFGTGTNAAMKEFGGTVKADHIATRMLLTFDWKFTESWRTNYGTVTDYKLFQIFIDGTTGWWTHMGYTAAAANAYPSDPYAVLSAEAVRMTQPFPVGIIQRDGPLAYQGSPLNGWPRNSTAKTDMVPQTYGVWTRYWFEVVLNQPVSAFSEWQDNVLTPRGLTLVASTHPALGGNWNMISCWTATPTSGPTRVTYRAPVGVLSGVDDNRLGGFRVEIDTSKTGSTGEWTAYFRNPVVLKDYALPSTNPESDTFIFQRPES